jgi:hypothetical protein
MISSTYCRAWGHVVFALDEKMTPFSLDIDIRYNVCVTCIRNFELVVYPSSLSFFVYDDNDNQRRRKGFRYKSIILCPLSPTLQLFYNPFLRKGLISFIQVKGLAYWVPVTWALVPSTLSRQLWHFVSKYLFRLEELFSPPIFLFIKKLFNNKLVLLNPTKNVKKSGDFLPLIGQKKTTKVNLNISVFTALFGQDLFTHNSLHW